MAEILTEPQIELLKALRVENSLLREQALHYVSAEELNNLLSLHLISPIKEVNGVIQINVLP